jgi:hypothetical protein
MLLNTHNRDRTHDHMNPLPGLRFREDAGGQLRETYVNREDFLIKRVAKFDDAAEYVHAR